MLPTELRRPGSTALAALLPLAALGVSARSAVATAPVLTAWILADPPSAFEKRRNQVLHDSWQGTRDPFIDHRE